MDDVAALRLAIDMLHMPSRVRQARLKALPSGMYFLLEVAAGYGDAAQRAAELTGRPLELVHYAAVFFVEQVLFSHNSDSYRVLGATPEASSGELRRNMALLLKWLHPDVHREGEYSVFAARVALAWDNLKTPDRRAAYDEAQSLHFAEHFRLREQQRDRRSYDERAGDGFWGRAFAMLFGRQRL